METSGKTLPKKNLPTMASTDAEVAPFIGNAATVIFLLRNYDTFGLAERVCYHFDLIESQERSYSNVPSSSPASGSSTHHPNISGVVRLLECSPLTPLHRLTKRQRRVLKAQLRSFNAEAEKVREERLISCYKPDKIPLRINPSTRMFFAYETTRIAFCIDASPSLTSTFGIDGSIGAACCPLDRIAEMARTYFQSLIEPISSPSMSPDWRPVLSVTVMAVFPLGKSAETSLLVRDYRVNDEKSAQILADRIDEWVHTDVEEGISERLCRPHAANTWGVPLYSSSMRDILQAGDYALHILSSEARPLMVVATDCRSVSCDGIVDVFLDIDRVDVPVTVLDLSMPETHTTEQLNVSMIPPGKSELNFLTYDPGGPADFPLHLADDAEALYGICRATGGCFLDSHRLEELSHNSAGQAPTADAPYQNSVKRRFVKMNGIQWLTLFSQSPLSPTFHSSWGKLAPPMYLQKRMGMADVVPTTTENNQQGGVVHQGMMRSNTRSSDITQGSQKRSNHSRVTFSTYVVSPIRIKALLLMHIKEGYRVKQYGMSTQDADKVFIQFTLPLELGTVLHYELSFRALSNQNHMVGSSHIKIELSGDPSFIQSVKKDFLRQTQDYRPFTMAQKISSRLCQVLRWIRTEDCLVSYLCPPTKWPEELSNPFVRRLDTMSTLQRRRHFTVNYFDVICRGRMPYAINDGFLSEFLSLDNGEQELFEFMNEWATQVVHKDSVYIKRAIAADGTTSYCLVELRQSHLSRLFAVSVMFYSGTDPNDRMETLANLKSSINDLKDVEVLSQQLGPYLVGLAQHIDWKKRNVQIQHHHAKWDLPKDPELLPLLMKRRAELGRFRLLESSDESAIFAKLIPEPPPVGSPGDLVQYQIEVLSDKVVIELFMESECGSFSPFGSSGVDACRFNGLVHVLRRRDQECGRALRSRTNLLSVFRSEKMQDFQNTGLKSESHKTSVQRILAYCSKVSIQIRFFLPGAGAANDILFQITENALLSKSFGVRAEKLNINPTDTIRDNEEGVWFIIQFDRYTMSLVHLALSEKEVTQEESIRYAYRDLTFFTNGVSDLYSKRDDMVDDDSADSHISEYLCVTEFADHLSELQKENFAAAAYLALRNNTEPFVEKLEKYDFDKVIEVCNFVEVANVLVMGISYADGENSTTDEHRKLFRLINTILRAVPGDEGFMFYCGSHGSDEHFNLTDDGSVSSTDSSMGASLGTQSGDGFDEGADADQRAIADDLQQKSPISPNLEMLEETKLDTNFIVSPPIFIRFRLDGKLVSTADLQAVTKNTNLSAEISIFKSRGSLPKGSARHDKLRLPWSHQVVGMELRALLKSHVAEQTVERLRHHGSSISDEDLQHVRKCLKRVRSVILSSIEVFFYISKTDSIVSASAPAGGEAEVAEGFNLLHKELHSHKSFAFKAASGGGFLVSSKQHVGGALEYWCLLNIQESEGVVTIQIYHPTGKAMADALLIELETVISSAVHRVNQRLLLKRLHRSRTASMFLIPAPRKPGKTNEPEIDNTIARFAPGAFSCPIVFRTMFDLYYRCATNPSHVSHNLEATVLHSFAVSNRPGIFVYKDEINAIFYMSLKPIGSGSDGDGKVELLVHGICEPGPSVTMQLRMLLQRRILQIAADMLSSVLTKNPHFNWKQADVDFLKSFEKDWKPGEGDKEKYTPQKRFYEFPPEAIDPCMVLLMFRQNICGSTFFHRLNDVGHEGLSPSIGESQDIDAGGVMLRWNSHDFTLYYNNAPSKLDPSFQGISTLTPKGAKLCREVGNGIAIIELSLVKSNGDPVEELPFARPAEQSNSLLEIDLRSIRFSRLSSFPIPERTDSTCVCVRIINTELSREHLHEWIALTLDQALVAWVSERWLEKAALGLLKPLPVEEVTYPLSEPAKMAITDQLCSGLPAITSILELSHDLPHPAIAKVESFGVSRSSSVATTTLEFLEKCVLAPLFSDESMSEQLQAAKSNMTIVRLSRYSKPSIVTLKWNESHRKVLVHTRLKGSSTEKLVEDSPVDCPEYICFCSLSLYGKKSKDIVSHARMYREVMIHDGISERSPSIELLQSVKKKHRDAFNRSLAFIFSVKRNRRSLLLYNWNPQIVKSVSTRLHDAGVTSLRDSERRAFSLQYRSLRLLAPSRGSKDIQTNKPTKSPRRSSKTNDDPKPTPVTETKRNISFEAPEESGPVPTRKIRRPVSIRRPKLIGKSVEGAALQAVAASRKRASANQFKNVTNPTPVKRAPPVGATRDTAKGGAKAPPKNDIATKKQIRAPQNYREQNDRVARDEALVRIGNDFNMLCAPKATRVRRQSYLRRESLIMLINAWWPKNETQSIPRSAAEFILSKAPLAWNDTCFMPPLPVGTTDMFLPVFARWIAAFTPGLNIVSVTQPRGTGTKNDSIFLSTVVKNLRGCKCFVVIKITKTRLGKTMPIVRSQGWILNLPRRPKEDQMKKLDSNVSSLLTIEKDAAGMNKLSSDTRQSLLLESLLFDFSASMVERAARLPDGRVENLKDLIPTIRNLTIRHPFEQQKRMPALNYRAFEATIVLKSYRDRCIDMFDAQTLFLRLHEEADDRDMLRCGAGLCFKRGISVRGSHSVCFLTTHPADTSKMLLLILCRTQGRNLSDFMFREGSNVAIHILDNIVLEAAGLAFKELKFVAEKLLRDALWKSFSSENNNMNPEGVQERVYEMLSLTTVKPLLQVLGPNVMSTTPEIATLLSPELCVDWTSCCMCMSHDPAFSPHWSIHSEETIAYLFFMKQEDVFLLLGVDANNTLVRSALVEKDETITQEHRQIAVQKFLNYLLHFIWQSL